MTDRIDRSIDPFRPSFFRTDHGRMRYVDEGRGPVILMAHGPPLVLPLP